MAKSAARRVHEDRLDTKELLQTLISVKKGDFTVRMPTGSAGIEGRIADTLNDIIEMMSENTREIERVSRVVGRDGKLAQRITSAASGSSRHNGDLTRISMAGALRVRRAADGISPCLRACARALRPARRRRRCGPRADDARHPRG